MHLSLSCSNALIMVMETAHFGNGAYVTTFRWLDRAGYWTIHVEGKVGTKSVVIAEVSC